MGRLAWALVLVALTLSPPLARAEEGAAGGVPQTAVEREMLVRFSRAYGMAKGALENHGLDSKASDTEPNPLRDPDQLKPALREEVFEIMERNRVQPEEWRAMFTQMDSDPALRERIESLAVPFGY